LANKNEIENREKRDLLSTALRVLPLATALLYLYSFCFDIGFLLHFGIPASQAQIGLELLGNAAAFLWPTFIVGFFYLPLNLYYWPPTQAGFYAIYFGFLTILLATQAVFIFDLRFLFVLPFFLISSWAYVGNIYRMRGRQALNRGELPPQVYDARSELLEGTIAEYFVKKRGFDPLVLVLLFLILSPGTFTFCGWAEGNQLKEPDTFLKDGQLLGIVRIYSDRVISVPLTSSGEVITGSYVLVPTLDIGEVKAFTARFGCSESAQSQNAQ
jgi:hypothetical protein